MKAIAKKIETAIPHSLSNQGTAKVFSTTVDITTGERVDFINLTHEIRDFVEASNISDGYLLAASSHTTAGLFVNEWQEALLADVKTYFSQLAPSGIYYRHNDPELSDCDRRNADSHLRNIIINQCISLPVARRELILGHWQSIILAEFDGPNKRKVFLQVLGI